MAERSDPPPGGGGTARPGAAIGGQPQQKKKKPKYPVGCPVVEVNETFDITEPSSGATITVRRTGEEVFSCAMPNCSQIFQVYTKNLSSMQSHAKSKHKPIPVVSLAAASGTRSGQVGETITVVVAFGNIGDANISHDFNAFKIAPCFSGPNQRGAKCTICGKVLAILAENQLQKHCDSDHPTAEVIDIRARIAAEKRQAELAGVQEAERQSMGGGMARFFGARIAGPAPPVAHDLTAQQANLLRAPPAAPMAPALARPRGLVAALRAALPDCNICAGYKHNLPGYPFILYTVMDLPWDASTDGTLRSHPCVVKETKSEDGQIDEDTGMCVDCSNIRFDVRFLKLEARAIDDMIHRTRTRDSMLTHQQLAARKMYAIKIADRWRLEYSKSKSRLAAALRRVDDGHRICELIARGKLGKLHVLMRRQLNRGARPATILKRLNHAISNGFHPRGQDADDREDFEKAFLRSCFGGRRNLRLSQMADGEMGDGKLKRWIKLQDIPRFIMCHGELQVLSMRHNMPWGGYV